MFGIKHCIGKTKKLGVYSELWSLHFQLLAGTSFYLFASFLANFFINSFSLKCNTFSFLLWTLFWPIQCFYLLLILHLECSPGKCESSQAPGGTLGVRAGLRVGVVQTQGHQVKGLFCQLLDWHWGHSSEQNRLEALHLETYIQGKTQQRRYVWSSCR